MMLSNFRGELAALGAALIWAIASYVYIHLGKQLSPMMLNLTKSSIAIALTLLTLGLLGDFAPQMSSQALVLLLISGAIGIGLGDTVFFEALNCLGSRRALLLESLAPPLTALMALIFLQEMLSSTAWLGIALTVTGVAWVVVERAPDAVQHYLQPWRGIGFGLVAAFCQASGSVLSRAALADTMVSPLWSTLIRLVAGVGILALWMVAKPQVWREFQVLRSPRLLGILTVASFASTFLAILLQQTAIKYTAAGIAQSLSATSPLFVIAIALGLRESVSIRAILGVFIALGGIWLLFQGQ